MARERGNFSLWFKLDGIEKLEKQLKALADPKTAKKIQRRAATAAIRPMRAACKEACPVDTGALKKSIDSKVSVKNRGVSAIVGADTAVMEDGKKGEKSESTVRAARVLHLVCFGFIDPSGKAVPGNNFLERGYHITIDRCQKIYADKLREGLEKAADEAGGK